MIVSRRTTFPLAVSLAAIAASAPIAAQQNPGSFDLPPNPSPTPTGPAVQGPVDDSGIIPQRPRAVNTPTPTPRPRIAPTPAATSSPAPTPRATTPPAARPSPAPGASPTLTPAASPTSGSTVPLPLPNATPVQSPLPNPTATATAAPPPSPGLSEGEEPGFRLWWWLAAGFAAALGLAWFVLRRRAASAAPPEIERPVVPTSDTGPGVFAARPPAIQAEAVNLSRSIMNATLQYRLSITNRTTSALTGIEVGGDLVAAHNRKPIGSQIADRTLPLALRHRLARIAPGQTVSLEGTIQLPLSEVQPIVQGNAPLLVPLMRWRITGEAMEPVARTWVVGIQPQVQGGRLQPFRLDEQPQNYSQIGARAID